LALFDANHSLIFSDGIDGCMKHGMEGVSESVVSSDQALTASGNSASVAVPWTSAADGYAVSRLKTSDV
jgi:hypothetical protein